MDGAIYRSSRLEHPLHHRTSDSPPNGVGTNDKERGDTKMRRKLLPLILGGALSVAAVAPASAATCEIKQGGAAGLVAAVSLVQANVCDVFILNDSLNNLLRNADIHVLENILNNSPILSFNDVDLDVDVDVEDNIISVTVLGGTVNILGS